MLWKRVITILLLAASAGAQTSGAPQASAQPKPPSVPRSPFASPLRVVSGKPAPSASAAAKPVAPASAAKPKPGIAPVATKPAAPQGRAAAKPTTVAIVTKPSLPPPPQPAPTAVEKKAEPEPQIKFSGHKRDPFISPVSMQTATATACTTGGKKCLVIDKIMLKGVVRADSGFIAVVVNSANRAYFLRENDPLFNGYVMRITGDAVTFRETGTDRLGHQTKRDVVKKLSGPSV